MIRVRLRLERYKSSLDVSGGRYRSGSTDSRCLIVVIVTRDSIVAGRSQIRVSSRINAVLHSYNNLAGFYLTRSYWMSWIRYNRIRRSLQQNILPQFAVGLTQHAGICRPLSRNILRDDPR